MRPYADSTKHSFCVRWFTFLTKFELYFKTIRSQRTVDRSAFIFFVVVMCAYVSVCLVVNFSNLDFLHDESDHWLFQSNTWKWEKNQFKPFARWVAFQSGKRNRHQNSFYHVQKGMGKCVSSHHNHSVFTTACVSRVLYSWKNSFPFFSWLAFLFDLFHFIIVRGGGDNRSFLNALNTIRTVWRRHTDHVRLNISRVQGQKGDFEQINRTNSCGLNAVNWIEQKKDRPNMATKPEHSAIE